jgi:hypothetical protein
MSPGAFIEMCHRWFDSVLALGFPLVYTGLSLRNRRQPPQAMPPALTLVYTNAAVDNFLDLRHDTSGRSTRPKEPLRDEAEHVVSNRTG